MRIARSDASLPPVERGPQITATVDGRSVIAFQGESVAALLLAEGMRSFRQTAKLGQGRGLYCGMGICYDCLVTVNGTPNIRACMTPVEQGMAIETRTV